MNRKEGMIQIIHSPNHWSLNLCALHVEVTNLESKHIMFLAKQQPLSSRFLRLSLNLSLLIDFNLNHMTPN